MGFTPTHAARHDERRNDRSAQLAALVARRQRAIGDSVYLQEQTPLMDWLQGFIDLSPGSLRRALNDAVASGHLVRIKPSRTWRVQLPDVDENKTLYAELIRDPEDAGGQEGVFRIVPHAGGNIGSPGVMTFLIHPDDLKRLTEQLDADAATRRAQAEAAAARQQQQARAEADARAARTRNEARRRDAELVDLLERLAALCPQAKIDPVAYGLGNGVGTSLVVGEEDINTFKAVLAAGLRTVEANREQP